MQIWSDSVYSTGVACTVYSAPVYSDPLSRDLGKSPVPGPALQAARQRPARHSVLAQSRAQAGKIWRIWPLAAPSQWRGGASSVSHSQTWSGIQEYFAGTGEIASAQEEPGY